jgi:hypothetical protein
LLIEAACFRLPSILWKYLSGHSGKPFNNEFLTTTFLGIKIQEIVKLSSDPNNIKPDIKKANIRSLTIHLQVGRFNGYSLIYGVKVFPNIR